jgi:serine/threonine protein kinase
VTSAGHGLAVDWWAFGILLYEMLCGFPPFDDTTSMGVYQKIMAGKLSYPVGMRAPEAKDLIQRLLVANPVKRLGFKQVGRSPFFGVIDFEQLEEKSLAPPWRPELRSPVDTSYVAGAAMLEGLEGDEGDQIAPGREASGGFLKDIRRLDAEFSQL